MNTIEKDELYDNLRQFLKAKGVELAEGSYAQTIQKSCRILADVINMGQTGLERAKTGLDRKLDQVRQCIHDKTAPKPPKMTSAARAKKASPASTTAESGASASAEATSPSANGRKARVRKPKPAVKGKTRPKGSKKQS